jgi:hypothetical protein
MTKTKFKVGDKVKISWTGDNSHGKIGTIVKKYNLFGWTVKIPGFDGHSGGIEDGTKDKWCVLEKHLTKLPPEKKSMKIEVKQTKKTEKPKEIVYPCFRKSSNGNDLIVLFFEETKGIVVDSGKSQDYHVEQFRENWLPNTFLEPLQNYSAKISSNP